MKTSTKYPTTTLTLTLAMILLAACDNEVIAPYTVLSPTPATDAAAEASQPASAQSFGPEALAGASGRFSIGVLPIVPEARPFQSAIWNAARRWTEILRETELPDVFILHGPKPDCHGINLDDIAGVVDDLVITVTVMRIDGAGGILARGGPCWVRREGSLPFLGIMVLDAADIQDLDAAELTELFVHETGHILGIGPLWGTFGRLQSPSLYSPGTDTHFNGPLAVAAFNAAGGRGYRGGKVPVENLMGLGFSDMHWRESVLGSELMTPVLRSDEANPLSAITIQSLADLGYTVDTALADAFTLSSAGAGAVPDEAERGRTIRLAGDLLTGPLFAFDPDGRVVQMLRR